MFIKFGGKQPGAGRSAAISDNTNPVSWLIVLADTGICVVSDISFTGPEGSLIVTNRSDILLVVANTPEIKTQLPGCAFLMRDDIGDVSA